jgi:hypothetical protein
MLWTLGSGFGRDAGTIIQIRIFLCSYCIAHRALLHDFHVVGSGLGIHAFILYFSCHFAVHAYSCLLLSLHGRVGLVLVTPCTHSMSMNDSICLTTARPVVPLAA